MNKQNLIERKQKLESTMEQLKAQFNMVQGQLQLIDELLESDNKEESAEEPE